MSGRDGSSGDLTAPFIFVPTGAPEPTAWMAAHPDWIKIPATLIPCGSASSGSAVPHGTDMVAVAGTEAAVAPGIAEGAGAGFIGGIGELSAATAAPLAALGILLYPSRTAPPDLDELHPARSTRPATAWNSPIRRTGRAASGSSTTAPPTESRSGGSVFSTETAGSPLPPEAAANGRIPRHPPAGRGLRARKIPATTGSDRCVAWTRHSPKPGDFTLWSAWRESRSVLWRDHRSSRVMREW